MGLKSRLKMYEMILNGYIKSLGLPKELESKQEHNIDFVVTWVDGNDSEWNTIRNTYLNDKGATINGNGDGRYRDWESFRYWFRAVEKFAPWVRKIHLVTWGHVPEWLDIQNPKLRIVKHSDFIPNEYLPTFNCNSIEMNLFRIPGLSENFVYFNDDMILCRPVIPTEFFVEGKPRHTAIAVPYINRDNEIPYHLFFNTYGLINKKNNIMQSIEKEPRKWFAYQYKSSIKYNYIAWKEAGLPGMYFTHMGVPFCKSTMKATWDKYEKECIETCMYKFRDIHQITHQLFSIEDILNGNFEPSVSDWGRCIPIDSSKQISDAYQSRKTKMICLFDRDNLMDEEIENINKSLRNTFGKFLPEKSSFEK